MAKLQGYSKNQILDLYQKMFISRKLDEKMLILLKQGKSFFHIGASGHEAAQLAAANLIASDQPNLRTIYPYTYDQRHQVITALDYRYGSGSSYNGPRIAGKELFKNTGANLVANFASGMPYSRFIIFCATKNKS